MKRNQKIMAVLLTILALGFIVFVAFMQNNFNNPEFDNLSVTTKSNAETSNTEEEVEDDSVAGAAGSIVSDEDEDDSNSEENDADENETDSEEEESEIVTSTQTVEAATLNAREGPGIDYPVTGVLEEGQEVTVEDNGEDWVKIITDAFEGYVNKNYLSGSSE